jgi:hypothetical protein
MPTPTRDQIARRVIHNLSIISGFAESGITDSDQKLADDLLMTEDLRGALAKGFQKIARAFAPAAVVRKTECKQLKTVKAVIDLVLQRAGGAV